jgi:hypothetical protein
MTRPAERVVGFHNQRGKAEQHIKEGKNAIKWTLLLIRRKCCPAATSTPGLQSQQLHADAGSAGGDQTVVDDQPAGKTREDRRQTIVGLSTEALDET